MSKQYVLALLLIALLALPAWPQASTGGVSGTVRDLTEAVVPSVTVTLVNTATGGASRTVTNEVGLYTFPGVVPGPYRLTIAHEGFERFEVTLTVHVGENLAIDPLLKPGQTATTVEVRDVTPIVKLDSPTLGHVLERQRIEQLPLNGRSITTLLNTVPGMEGNRAYGLREGSQDMILDGATLTDRNWGGNPRRQPGLDSIQEFNAEDSGSSAKFSRPTPILYSTRSGTNDFHGSLFEFNRNNGYGKARRREEGNKPSFLNRNEFGGTAGGPVWLPKLYDGRNRTFWFFSHESHRNIAPYSAEFQVPTEAMRNGDFSQLYDDAGRFIKIYNPWTTDSATWSREQFSYQGRANVIDPVLMSPLAKKLFDITPAPTHPDVNPLVDSNWIGPVPNTTRQWTLTTRFDHRFSDNDQVYVRYTQGSHHQLSQFYGQPMLNNVAGMRNATAPNRSAAVSWVRTLSPTWFNELLVSFSRENAFSGTGEPGVKYAEELGLPNPFNKEGWPAIYETGLGNYYFETENMRRAPFTYALIDDNITKVVGRHELQFGGHYRFDQLNYMYEQQHTQGSHEFNTLSTALYDPSSPRSEPYEVPNTGQYLANMFIGSMNYSANFARGYFYARSKEYAFYFQDRFRVTPRLTLSLGLRWEYWPPYREKYNMLVAYDPDRKAAVLGSDLESMYRVQAALPSIVDRYQQLGLQFLSYQEAGWPERLMDSTRKNFGPRLGFAYRLTNGDRAAVLRGGYRVSYFPIPMSTWGQRQRMNVPSRARFTNYSANYSWESPDGISNYSLRSAPTIIAGKNSSDAIPTNDASFIARGEGWLSYFAKEQPDTRVQDWNLTLEKEVLPDTVARVAAVGNHTSNLEQYYRYNEAPPAYVWYRRTGLPTPTGEFGNVAMRPHDQQVLGTIEEFQKSGWSNYGGVQFELERRFSKGYGFQVFYNIHNVLGAGGGGYGVYILDPTQFLPGAVPEDMHDRARFLNYRRERDYPKHSVRWNWVAELPFGKGKPLGGNASGALEKLIGGWQISGMGYLRSTYFELPTNLYPTTGNPVEIYGYKHPIQDCRSGTCTSGYLWWNGYIPPHKINSYDANGQPNGVMGVPESYRPAGQPLNPWPANPDPADPMYELYGTNDVTVTLNDGSRIRTAYNDNLHPWRNQYFSSVRQWSMDAQLSKRIPITEQVALQIKVDAFNVFNAPNNFFRGCATCSDGSFSTLSSAPGYANFYPREIQLGARLTW